MAIKTKLKEVRKKKGLTQLQLAYKLGMTPQYVQKIENDVTKSFSKDTLNKLCKILDCEPGDLIAYLPDEAIAT